MNDPVELPSSKNVMDRISIKKHLLNDPTDPFNRSELKVEDLIERPDLKQRIEEYKAMKLSMMWPKVTSSNIQLQQFNYIHKLIYKFEIENKLKYW